MSWCVNKKFGLAEKFSKTRCTDFCTKRAKNQTFICRCFAHATLKSASGFQTVLYTAYFFYPMCTKKQPLSHTPFVGCCSKQFATHHKKKPKRGLTTAAQRFIHTSVSPGNWNPLTTLWTTELFEDTLTSFLNSDEKASLWYLKVLFVLLIHKPRW